MRRPEFRRGDIVTNRGEIGVIWAVAQDRLVVFAVIQPDDQRAGDVTCDGDAPSMLRAATIRVGCPRSISARGQTRIGELPGGIACRVSQAVARVAATAATEAAWEGHGDMAHHRNQPHCRLDGR